MSTRIKILSVFHEIEWGGDQSRALSMSQTMDHERFEHMVLRVLDPPEDPEVADFTGFQDRERQFADMGVQLTSLSKEIPERVLRLRGVPAKLYGKTRVLRRAKRLARFIRQWGADVIDARTAAALVGVLAGKMAGTPTTVTFYGEARFDDARLPWTMRLPMRLADRIVTDSEVRAREFRAQLPRSEHKVVAIPNGIPAPQSTFNTEEARNLFGLPADPRVRVIGQIARLIEYKGQAILIHAAKKILEQDPDVAFLIVGYTLDKHYWHRLNRLVQELGIANRVRIASYPGPIGDVWKTIDIHAHASLLDSQPISVIEGMSLGKPAVVTSVGGISEIVEHGRSGLMVPPGDPDALSVSILELLKNQDLARRLGQGARDRYEQRHRPEMMTRSLEKIFLEIVN